MRVWYLSVASVVACIMGVIIASLTGLLFIAAISLLLLPFAAGWLGWSLHVRKLWRDSDLERRILQKHGIDTVQVLDSKATRQQLREAAKNVRAASNS